MPVANLNHHLWRNGRLWWVAFTVIYDGWRQERVRRSLRTADLEEARRRRDEIFLEYAAAPSAEVVALREAVVSREDTAAYARQQPAATEPFTIRPGLASELRNSEPSAFGIDPFHA
jgi:hypothetical protein